MFIKKQEKLGNVRKRRKQTRKKSKEAKKLSYVCLSRKGIIHGELPYLFQASNSLIGRQSFLGIFTQNLLEGGMKWTCKLKCCQSFIRNNWNFAVSLVFDFLSCFMFYGKRTKKKVGILYFWCILYFIYSCRSERVVEESTELKAGGECFFVLQSSVGYRIL